MAHWENSLLFLFNLRLKSISSSMPRLGCHGKHSSLKASNRIRSNIEDGTFYKSSFSTGPNGSRSVVVLKNIDENKGVEWSEVWSGRLWTWVPGSSWPLISWVTMDRPWGIVAESWGLGWMSRSRVLTLLPTSNMSKSPCLSFLLCQIELVIIPIFTVQSTKGIREALGPEAGT